MDDKFLMSHAEWRRSSAGQRVFLELLMLQFERRVLFDPKVTYVNVMWAFKKLGLVSVFS